LAFVALAPPPRPVVVAASSSTWLLAPAAAPGMSAWLEVPVRLGGGNLLAGAAGDRLRVRFGARRPRTLYDGACDVASDCLGVRRPVAAGRALVYAVSTDGTSGYVAIAGADGRSHVLANDENGTPPLAFAADAARVVWAAPAGIVGQPPDRSTPPRVLVPAASLGGVVRTLATTGERLAWSAVDARGAVHVRVQARRGGPPRELAAGAAVARLGPLDVGADGRVAAMRRVRVGRRQRLEIVAFGAGAPQVVDATPWYGPRVALPLGRVDVTGADVVYRVTDGRRGRLTAIRIVDLLGIGDPPRLLRRVSTAAARLSEPVADGNRIVWAESTLAGRRLRRSRILFVRVAL
jgi:hypothetical protein